MFKTPPNQTYCQTHSQIVHVPRSGSSPLVQSVSRPVVIIPQLWIFWRWHLKNNEYLLLPFFLQGLLFFSSLYPIGHTRTLSSLSLTPPSVYPLVDSLSTTTNKSPRSLYYGWCIFSADRWKTAIGILSLTLSLSDCHDAAMDSLNQFHMIDSSGRKWE